jgi:hypothetical protein
LNSKWLKQPLSKQLKIRKKKKDNLNLIRYESRLKLRQELNLNSK